MVLELVQKLSNRQIRSYIVYLNNYFTNISLFEQLRNINIDVCNTTRVHVTGDDYPVLIKKLRSNFVKSLSWNTVVTFVIYENKILTLCWQDNNVVIILSTVHTVDKTTNLIERKRRRLNKSSTNAVIVCQSFRKEVRKTLFISIFINDYNHYIRDVDLTN